MGLGNPPRGLAATATLSAVVGLTITSKVSCFVPSALSTWKQNPSCPSRTFISNTKLRASSNAGWSASDDWSRLSSESELIDTSAIFNADISGEAARALEKEAEEAADALASANAGTTATASATATAEDPDDALIADAVETIQNSIDPSDPPLYDSPSSFAKYSSTDDAAEQAAREIGLLIRCNERPEDLLVSEGRALPVLTDEERYDVKQMVRVVEDEDGDEERYVATDFFALAVLQIFNEHATVSNDDGDNDETVLDASGVASWLTKSLGDETHIAVGMHSKEVGTIMSRYGTYGSAVITEDQFQKIYLDAVVNAMRAQERRGPLTKQNGKMTQPTAESIWRDLRNHGILPPAEEQRKKLQAELDAENGTGEASDSDSLSSSAQSTTADTIFDECEILEWGEADYSNPRSYFDINDGVSSSSGAKSSHELVELSSDRKTPKRIRDGGFVFIDEESCIGCMQCATVAPSTFVMLENGRARTYQQGSSPEIKAAVSSCPVSCMHYVGFKELKKYETARDHGDGRNDHRHFGGRNTHIPLNVAGIDSDANRRSSWYHYLRHKCYTSKQCPQKGCYDCPNYSSPGQNPYFQERHRRSERARAKDLMESGEADLWRKKAEL
mmetsp:Transcript_10007/g.22364  ORF Transcript_10007/g.22364 Transcript_10007/m.22364 type:complete len:618 (-) Transcript_10007:117-1970(-)